MNMPGLKIGHATDVAHHTGCTVLLLPEGTVGSVDVRGLGPATRETALLAADKHVEQVHAVVLSGGSAYGLATADGVMRFLAERKIGYYTPVRPVPIVPAACVFDLFLSRGERLPDAEMGYQACTAAVATGVAQGNVGGGAGATVGKWSGPAAAMKGGFGLGEAAFEAVTVTAAAVVNAIGDVVDDTGSVLAGARDADGGWAAAHNPYRIYTGPPPAQITNTTLVAVVTNARLSKVEANRLAQRAHDGLAIAIRPAHSPHDGDVAFALATGQVEGTLAVVANLAVTAVVRAIQNAVRAAATVGPLPGLAG